MIQDRTCLTAVVFIIWKEREELLPQRALPNLEGIPRNLTRSSAINETCVTSMKNELHIVGQNSFYAIVIYIGSIK